MRKLIRAGAKHDDPDFRAAAEQLIAEERDKKHHLLANDLERLLTGREGGRPQSRPSYLPPVPVDQEHGVPLAEVREPVRDLKDVVLSDENRSALREVIEEQDRRELLGSVGLRPASRLLLVGPPGCGKTLTAEVLATELSLPLVLIRFDAVISSFLGQTAANLRLVFDFIETGRYVVLFDEFDAIGKERSDPGEHGELRRVVNSFLQMLDGYRGDSVLIAATNHEGLLDSALWRRFDEVLLLDKPNLEQLQTLLELKLRAVRHELDPTAEKTLGRFKGKSHADVERILARAIKAMLLSGREYLSTDLVEEALRSDEVRTRLRRGQ